MILTERKVLALLERPENLPVALQLKEWIDQLRKDPDAPSAASELLNDAEALATAQEIARLLEQARMRIHARFWTQVQIALDARIRNRADHASWKTALSLTPGDDWVAILRADGDPYKSPQICVEALYGHCYLGFCTYAKSGTYRALEKALAADGYRSEDKWPGYKFLQAFGLSALSGRPDDKIHLNSDNRTRAHPLATRIAELTFDLFERYAKDLRALKSGRAKSSRPARSR
jgi:hypothetical protein